MLFITGLLTLLALSNAGGDHTKGGDHHIKGGESIASGTKTAQTQVVEGIIPSPYSFNINTGAAYGARVSREEVGDAEGRVKGFYTLSSPRGATRVVEYVADQTGFHANVKTSEPNIKTHSPANVLIESIPKTVGPIARSPFIPAPSVPGGVKSVNVPEASVPIVGKTQIREPTARPVSNQQPIRVIQPIPTITGKANEQFYSKTALPQQHNYVTDQEKVSELSIIPLRRGIGDIQPNNINFRIGAAGNAVRQPISRPVQQIAPNPLPLFDAPVYQSGGHLTGGAREVIILEDGTIVDVGDVSGNIGQNIQIPFDLNSAVYTDTSRVRGQPARKPVVAPVRTSVGITNKPVPQPVFKPKPIAFSQTLPKHQLSDEIKELNRQLIQRQNEAGFSQTFGGVVKSDSDVDKISISADQLDNIRKGIRYDTNKQITRVQLRKPDGIVRSPPTAVRQRIPAVTSGYTTSAIRKDERFKFTGSGIVPGRATGSVHAIPRQPAAVPVSTFVNQGDNIKFVLGNTATSVGTRHSSGEIIKPKAVQRVSLPKPKTVSRIIPVQKPVAPTVLKTGLNDDIITINRQLIQTQNQKDFKQIFEGVVPADADIGRISFSEDQLGDISKQFRYGVAKPVAPVREIKKPVEILKSNVVRQRIPTIEKPKISSGYAAPVRNRDKIQSPVQVISVSNQASDTTVGDEIVGLNRQLIQKQSEEDFKQIFGSVIKSDSDIEGISLSLDDIDGISRKVGYGGEGHYTPVEIKPEVISLNPGTVRQITPVLENPKPNVFVVGNTAGILESARPLSRPISLPRTYNQPQIQLSDDIIAINRELIQKQNEEGFKQTFGSIAKNEDDLSGISISSGELGGLSNLAKYDVVKEFKQTPKPVKPIQLAPVERPKITSVYGTRLYSRNQYPVVGSLPGQTRPTSNSAFVIQDNSGGAVSRTASGVQRTVTRTATGYVSPQRNTNAIRSQEIFTIPQRTPIAVRSQAGVQIARPQVEPKKELSAEIIAFNRNLIDKQNTEGLLQTFGGIIKSETDVDGLTISEEELGDLSKIVGYGLGNPTAARPLDQSYPATSGQRRVSKPQEVPSFRRQSPSAGQNLGGSRQTSGLNSGINLRVPVVNRPNRNQLQEIVDQDGIESPPVILQEKFESGFPSQEQVSIGSTNDESQEQVKIDGFVDQDSQQKSLIDVPVQTFLQEIPVEVPRYAPASSYIPPLNYRVPPIRNQVRQEQQKLEQILVR